MKRRWTIAGVATLCIALYVGAYLMVNSSIAGETSDIARVPLVDLPAADDVLDITTWNVGYGGLGAGSDFVADGGAHYFPPSRRAVRDNVRGIATFLSGEGADIVLLQELARPSPVNLWHDVKGAADRALSNTDRSFYADFRTRLMPWPLSFRHGQGVYARRAIASVELVPLPAEGGSILGAKRRYAALAVRIPISGRDRGWTIASLHLAAFDKDAAVRRRQLSALLRWAESEYESGQHVVLGGDFNLELAETHFPYTTAREHLFWLFPFPDEGLPAGWRIAADPGTASVRTNERPYRRGENYTTVIDGFIVSPNVAAERVAGVDLDFQNADHNPVRVRVRATGR
ncbi:MAG: endonuclease/exonuclease/phosphatase family protein [Hyphomonadaceae bacterium]|nr:endonuclease/exonuclease/phosphatase family protein [Hyphomonadaceae bacterium]